eukprot:9497633-Pyramimonas_sp.AAC.1
MKQEGSWRCQKGPRAVGPWSPLVALLLPLQVEERINHVVLEPQVSLSSRIEPLAALAAAGQLEAQQLAGAVRKTQGILFSTHSEDDQAVSPRRPLDPLHPVSGGPSFHFCTVNASSWGRALEYAKASRAHVIFVQEHKLFRPKILEAKTKARKLGWNSFWAPALATEAGFASGGVAILFRSYLDVLQEYGKGIVVPGRVLHALCRTRSFGLISLCSNYWHSAVGLGKKNLD